MNLIRQARQARGWTSTRLNAALREVASTQGITTASQASLRVMISNWENDRQVPDATYQLLLRMALNLPAAALGFDDTPAEASSRGVVALVRRGAQRLTASGPVLDYFRTQFAQHVLLDNATGPGLLLDVVDAQVGQLRRFAESGDARDVVELTAKFLEHAGWLRQDSCELDEALQLTQESVDLAELAGDPQLLAYNLMRKSNILTARQQPGRARVTARRAVEVARQDAPEQVPVCLRQVALTEAVLKNAVAARDSSQDALSAAGLTASVSNDLSSYCTPSYLEMESARCLLVLGTPRAAVDACGRALGSWPEDGLVRDRALCLVRLAQAHLETNELDAACTAAISAVSAVALAPSGRVLESLQAVSRRLQPFQESRHVREFRAALAEVA